MGQIWFVHSLFGLIVYSFWRLLSGTPQLDLPGIFRDIAKLIRMRMAWQGVYLP